MLTSWCGLGNLSISIFGKINLTETETNSFAAWKFKSKIAEVISVCTLNPLRLDSHRGFNNVLSGF